MGQGRGPGEHKQPDKSECAPTLAASAQRQVFYVVPAFLLSHLTSNMNIVHAFFVLLALLSIANTNGE